MENTDSTKRVTKNALLKFIDEIEDAFPVGYEPGEEWQSLREYVGLPRLTPRMILARQIAWYRATLDLPDMSEENRLERRRALLRLEYQLLDMDSTAHPVAETPKEDDRE